MRKELVRYFFEFIIEFMLFSLLFILFGIISLGQDITFSLSEAGALVSVWLVTVAYRALFLQIPISFFTYILLKRRFTERLLLLKCLVNAVSFLVIFMISNSFSPILASFMSADGIVFPVIVFLSVVLAPIFVWSGINLRRK